ncbi:putative Importin [Zostera marina]|uniref:Putative Importin n=1 Tax=Zostera marina TaxID=29655 RepID=A0A0K9P5X6_ZOSMR|nr:putative Importin [Zostera marina]
MALSTADIQAVYSLLSNALSTDDSIRKPAELSLSQCESRPGFCSCLFEIIAARDLVSQGEIRLMASVYFKNSVTRYWRKRRDSLCIGNDEKIHLRNKLMSHNREENPKIALLLAVLVSKIARTDYPKEWPDLFSNLAQQIQSTDNLAAHRGFMILLRTLKELESKRLNSDQRIFSEIASQLFDYCWKHWQSDVQSILQNFSALSQCSTANSLSGQMDDFFLVCERWFMCTKIIRHLVISGHRSDVLDGVEVVCPVKEVCPVILNAVQMFLPYYSSFPEGQPKLWEFVKKVSTKLMKILVAVQARHPYSFGDKDILGPMTDFCLNKIVNPDPAILSFRSFLIQCMIMVKSTLECKVYKPSSTGRVIGNSLTLEQRKTNISNNISELLSTMFSSERVILVCNVLIRRYCVGFFFIL